MVEYRFADGNLDRLPTLATELVGPTSGRQNCARLACRDVLLVTPEATGRPSASRGEGAEGAARVRPMRSMHHVRVVAQMVLRGPLEPLSVRCRADEFAAKSTLLVRKRQEV